MVFFAITRKGYESYLALRDAVGALWLGAEVLSDEEVAGLRQLGISVSVFNHVIEPHDTDVLANAVETIKEHHLGEPLWIEG